MRLTPWDHKLMVLAPRIQVLLKVLTPVKNCTQISCLIVTLTLSLSRVRWFDVIQPWCRETLEMLSWT